MSTCSCIPLILYATLLYKPSNIILPYIHTFAKALCDYTNMYISCFEIARAVVCRSNRVVYLCDQHTFIWNCFLVVANACGLNNTHSLSQFKLLLHRDFTEKFPCSTTRSPKIYKFFFFIIYCGEFCVIK